MKHYLYAAALLAPLAAPLAQVTYTETETTTTNDFGTVTTESTTFSATATPAPIQTVLVKLPDGTTATIPNTADAPWYTDARIGGSRNFSFDPISGAYVIYGGDKFAKRWDDNGNPVKVVVKPKPQAAAKPVEPMIEDVKAEPVAETTTESLALEAAMAEAVTPTGVTTADATPTVTTTVSTTVTTTIEHPPVEVTPAH